MSSKNLLSLLENTQYGFLTEERAVGKLGSQEAFEAEVQRLVREGKIVDLPVRTPRPRAVVLKRHFDWIASDDWRHDKFLALLRLLGCRAQISLRDRLHMRRLRRARI